MLGRSHVTSGVLAGGAVASLLDMPPKVAAGFVAITAVSALLPDFDHPDATMPRWFGLPGRVLAEVIGRVFEHRGLTHSLLGVGGLIVALAMIPAITALPLWVSGAVVLGCITHIVGDSLTVSGVPLLWPNDARFGLRLFETGGEIERLLVMPVMTLAIGWIAAHHLGVL